MRGAPPHTAHAWMDAPSQLFPLHYDVQRVGATLHFSADRVQRRGERSRAVSNRSVVSQGTWGRLITLTVFVSLPPNCSSTIACICIATIPSFSPKTRLVRTKDRIAQVCRRVQPAPAPKFSQA